MVARCVASAGIGVTVSEGIGVTIGLVDVHIDGQLYVPIAHIECRSGRLFVRS